MKIVLKSRIRHESFCPEICAKCGLHVTEYWCEVALTPAGLVFGAQHMEPVLCDECEIRCHTEGTYTYFLFNPPTRLN